LGLESDQILGRATSDYASERTEGEQHAENDARVIESGEVQVSDEVFTSPDGTQRVFQSSKAPLRDATGKIVGIAGVSVDVTDQRHTAEQLRISEQRLRLALQAGRMAVWDHDAINDKLAASPELNKVLGYPEDYPLTIEEVRSRYLPGQRERLLSRLQDTLSRGENYAEGELLYQHPDGSVRSYAISGEIILDEQGQVSRTTGVLLDISRLRTTEASLMEREAELQAALEAGKLAIVDFDHRTGLFRDSPRLNELYGYAPGEQLTLEHVRARYHPDEAELVRSRAKIEGSDPSLDSFRWIIRLLLPDGADRWVEGVGEYIRDESGAILRSRGVLMDVTERVRADRHQQLLIAELNHRVKNTLAVVQSIAVHSFRGSETGTQVKAFEQRLGALASVHNLLTRHNWEGTTLGEVMEESVRPFRQTHADAFTFHGPRIEVSPKTAVNLALAVTELATNALKYGALSAASGQVCIQWSLSDDGSFELSWRESGGPSVTKPERRGFGTRMIERVLANELQGSVELNFGPEGVSCTVRAPAQPSLN
jgi:PAS domain S-box-containing protein